MLVIYNKTVGITRTRALLNLAKSGNLVTTSKTAAILDDFQLLFFKIFLFTFLAPTAPFQMYRTHRHTEKWFHF